jgi:Tfp pilus assembly protein PilF
LGSALIALKRHSAAVECLDKAIALKPDLIEAHSNRAAALNSLMRHQEALAGCDKALALKPDFPAAHNNRAHALIGLGRFQEAAESADATIALSPNFPEAYNNRGRALNAVARHEDAIASYARAIALKPDYAEAYNNCGSAFCNLARPVQALASYDRAIALRSEYAEAHSNRGTALGLLNRHEEALASYDNAIAIRLDYVDAHFNKSLCLLVMGRFEAGWNLYEWRKKKPTARAFSQPSWLGTEDIAGKTILLHEEQGFGDTIQFCRYAPLVAELGARVILEVSPALTNLLATLEGVTQIIPSGSSLPDFDFQCPLLSLPVAFKTQLSSIPSKIPYLRPNFEKSLAWKKKLGSNTKLRVGLVWSGGVRSDQPDIRAVKKRRNIPLAKLAPLKHPNIEFYSLQKGQSAESELSELKRQNWDGPNIIDLAGHLHDFSDTAALIDNLDLVVSVDTSTAHLAGALGKPVWILNRYDSCWRWLLGRTDSPWYRTATLYRQEAGGNWDGVIKRVKADLSDFQPGAA